MKIEAISEEQQKARAAERSCGDCSLCCKLYSVKELNKPSVKWCEHAKPGRPGGACTIYDRRPHQCSIFVCYWRHGVLPIEMKPNRVHAVFGPSESGKGWFVHLDPAYPGIEEREPLKSAIATVAAKEPVVTICGDRYRLYSDRRVQLRAPDGSIWLSSEKPETIYRDPVGREPVT